MPMMNYGDYKETSLFVKLTQGENRVRLVTEPYVYKKSFKEGDPAKERYAWVVIDRSDGELRYLNAGPSIMKAIVALANDGDYGDPKGYDIKINREGEGLDTSYHVIPGPKLTLNAQERATIKGFKIDFAGVCGGDEEVSPDEVPDFTGDAINF